ncbi:MULTISPECIES: hypothetical protein [Ferrimonas]|nr:MULTISPECIES: hypothetical protein [Ferrimonas]
MIPLPGAVLLTLATFGALWPIFGTADSGQPQTPPQSQGGAND